MTALDKKEVKQIKEDLCSGELSQRQIAAKYGVSRGAVSDIASERRHKDVPFPDGKRPTRRSGVNRVVPQYDPTDLRIRELEAEVLHLKAERNHARKEAKQNDKHRGLFRSIVEELENNIVPFIPHKQVYNPRVRKSAIQEHVVMHLSDGHHDQIVEPSECGGLEEYNFEISCRRAENYVDTVIDWTQGTLTPTFQFQTLTVFAYGDHTSGEIHDHTPRSAFRNQFKNCFAIGQLHASMLRDLAPHFGQVNVIYLPGNHGRRTPKKDHHGAHNNFDYLVAEIARLHCANTPNISFQIPDAFSCNVVIDGVGFNLSHGDDVRGNMGLPFYGMQRRQKGLIALNASQGGPRIRYFCMGHHHVAASLADVDGELIVNGAWVASDAYVYNTFAGFREPSQLLHGVNKDHGITWRMNVHLRSKDEKKGPKRYKISV